MWTLWPTFNTVTTEDIDGTKNLAVATVTDNFWSNLNLKEDNVWSVTENIDLLTETWGIRTNTTENLPINENSQGTSIVSGFSLVRWSNFALVFLFSSIIAGTVIGNTLVIAAVTTTRRLRTVTNCFVMSLAVADWLVGMFVMPPKVVLHLLRNVWPLGRLLCELWISLDILLCTASILSLCAISIDRYLAITRPLAYSRKRRSKRLALSMISCVWVAAVVITSPPILGWYDSERNSDEVCNYNNNAGYVVYSALGSFFLPLLVMLYVYARIACVIAHRQKTMQRIHKNPEKKYFDSEETAGDDMLQNLRVGRSGETTLNKNSDLSTTSHKWCFTTQSNLWRCLRLKNTSKKSQQNHINVRGCNSGQSCPRIDLSEIPSPQTILSLKNGNYGRDEDSTNLTFGRKGSSTNNGSRNNMLRMRTGSRLCHHSLSNSSPQKNIIQRVQASTSTTRASIFAEDDLTLRRNYSRPDLHTSRVWTIEDGPELQGTSKRHGSTPNLTKLTNGRLVPCNCHSDSDNFLNEVRNVSQTKSLARRETSIPKRRLYEVRNQNHVLRSKSVKLNFHVGDKNQRSLMTREVSSGRVASFKRETKTAQTLAAVVGGFIICWLPFFVAYVIGPFIKDDTLPPELMEAFIWLGWGNSAINPFIYAFYSPDFRSAFWRLTFKKFEGILGSRSPDRGSPRRYEEPTPHLRTST